MQKTLKTIKETKYPIQVTDYLPADSLKKWVKHFADKGIKTILRQRNNRVSLFRAVTPEEITEIKQGLVVIRGGSFKEIR
jgi:arsenate reductase-like glutaredoxin family protein